MNPHRLELFYYVAKCKGVSQAAREMPYGIQQPSISAQVNALERDLGVILYKRRPFKLTAAGEELFRFVEPFFGRIEEVRQRLQGAARIRIGASPIVFRDYLPPVMDAMRKKFPGLNIILRASNQPVLMEDLERAELDVVISLIPDRVSSTIQVDPVMNLPLVLLAPRKSKIESAEELWKRDRIDEPLIALGPDELICLRFQEGLAKLGVGWQPQIELDWLELIENYAAMGYGIGLSAQIPGKKFSTGVRVLPLPGFVPVRLAILQRTGAGNSVVSAFLSEVKKHARPIIGQA